MSKSIALSDSVQYLKGVGPARAELLEKIGVRTVEDLLYLVPREYLDLRQVKSAAQLDESSPAIVTGKIHWIESRMTKAGVPIFDAECKLDTETVQLRWFHRPDLKEWLKVDLDVQVTGKPKRQDGRWVFTNPKIRPAEAEMESGEGLVPIYPLTDGLKLEQIRAFIAQVLPAADQVVDLLPPDFRERRQLPAIADAFREIHQPTSAEGLEKARHRLIYDEFLSLQLALALKRNSQERQKGHVIHVSAEVDRRIRRLFPFSTTADQDQAILEITASLAGPAPMHRLLMGDVGTGKTAVAIYAILATVAAGLQAAFMAPTEILARQQFATLDRYLAHSRVRRRLLTGAAHSTERAEIIDALFRHQLDLVVGTHSLIQPDVRFAHLGLVVIDEQHKFGVRQRADLLDQEVTPHQLVMTATPIPRSLAMTWFGDLDCSVLRNRPAGRGEVTTHVVPLERRDDAYDYLSRAVRQGNRGLVVCPRIHDGDGLRGAESVYEELRRGKFAGIPIALVHGKMDEHAKEETIRQFRRGDIAVLIATVVVEVGLDVPEASVVVIENAERFGLSQLHQIRGRVGRGTQASYCFLINTAGTDTRERLQSLVSASDGFTLAEIDAQNRGIGDLLGERQHGFVRPRVGDYQIDLPILEEARRDAVDILSEDPALRDPKWDRLRASLRQRFAKSFGLALVG